jgi:activating signal cointegrator complex subunit 3
LSSWVEPVKGGSENTHGKVNILLQTYISGGSPVAFSLVSDMAYVAQNAARILRGLFEITLRRNWASLTQKLLTLCKMLDRRMWDFQTPLRQVFLDIKLSFLLLMR